ncbi:MAG: branched-chain amino acid transport system substrate-binding protein [Actinomycetota bacterium]|nr:branched-chain amino acid transport system substrate-binding protein [Actinomycetota bacterium]
MPTCPGRPGRPGDPATDRLRSVIRRGTPAAAVAGVIVLSLAGCTSSSGAGAGGSGDSGGGATVKVAALYPLSGSNGTQGLDTLHGVELATEVVNGDYPDIDLGLAKGTGLTGLGGRKVELTSVDTQGDPQKGAASADQAVTGGKAVALIGAYQSAVTKAASQRAERLGVPFVNGASSSTELTERGLNWFFRTGPSDATFARTFFDFVDAQRKAGKPAQRVAIFHGNEDYGNNGAKITTQLATERGYDVVADVSYDTTATDLTSQVQQLRVAKPDIVFVLSYTDPAAKFVSTLKQLNWYPSSVLAYGAGFVDPAFIKGSGADAEGMMTRASWSQEIAQARPSAKAVAELFQKKYNQPMTENSARSFTAALTLFQAIDTAKSTEPEKIKQALIATDVPGDKTIMPWTRVKFDDKHQNTGASGVVEQMKNGEYKVVFPADVATTQAIWPFRTATAG